MSAPCVAVPFTPFPPEKLTFVLDRCELHRPWFGDHLWEDPKVRRQTSSAYIADALLNGKIWEVWRADEIVGILLLNELQPFVSARAHMLFFDSKLGDKRALCLQLMAHAFESIPLETLRVELPTYARALLKFIRQLGFRYEGEQRSFSWPTNAEPLSADVAKLGSRKHRAILYKGEWQDALLLSVTRDEFFAAHPKEQHGWSKRDTAESSAAARPDAARHQPLTVDLRGR